MRPASPGAARIGAQHDRREPPLSISRPQSESSVAAAREPGSLSVDALDLATDCSDRLLASYTSSPPMPTSDTFALVEGARSGDARARSELFDALRARLVLWAASQMSPSLRAKFEPDDLAQEVLLAVHRDLDGFTGRDRRTFYAWVFRIAENRLRDLADHFGAAKRREVEIPRSSQTTPGTDAARNEAVRRLADAIADLPEDHRCVVQLRRLEEREFAEIAAALGRSENAVRIVYCRALKALRQALGESR